MIGGASILGLTAAVGWIVSFVIYVAAVLLIDYLILRAKGVDYTITYGIRWLIQHMPVIPIVLFGGFALLVIILLAHFIWGMTLIYQ